MNAHTPVSPSRALRQASQPRRGLSRDEAAVYLGISPRKFDEGVAAGIIPQGKTGGFLGTRRAWDIRALDRVWDDLPDEDDANPWDR